MVSTNNGGGLSGFFKRKERKNGRIESYSRFKICQ